MRVDALRVEPCLLGELTEDQEGAGARQRPAACVQEELLSVAAVEIRPPA
jgi:hypothetical protein